MNKRDAISSRNHSRHGAKIDTNKSPHFWFNVTSQQNDDNMSFFQSLDTYRDSRAKKVQIALVYDSSSNTPYT
jgi:hypothetical protein